MTGGLEAVQAELIAAEVKSRAQVE